MAPSSHVRHFSSKIKLTLIEIHNNTIASSSGTTTVSSTSLNPPGRLYQQTPWLQPTYVYMSIIIDFVDSCVVFVWHVVRNADMRSSER